jgi:hypothetical protein
MRSSKLRLQLARQPQVVGIQKGDPLRRRAVYAEIARPRDALVRRAHQLDQRAAQPLDDLCRAIARPVIDHDDAVNPIALLRQYALKRRLYRLAAVKDRNKHVHARKILHSTVHRSGNR